MTPRRLWEIAWPTVPLTAASMLCGVASANGWLGADGLWVAWAFVFGMAAVGYALGVVAVQLIS